MVKWTANKPAKPVLASMSEDKLAPLVRTIDLQADNEPLPNLKAIGCLWDAEKDTLKVKFFLDRPSDYTRCSFLSQISRQYDPLGYSVPLFVKARFILQQLAIEGFSWDEPLNSSYAKAWNNWLDTLIKWPNLALPRWYFAKAAPLDVNADTQYELHAFSDASNEAYECRMRHLSSPNKQWNCEHLICLWKEPYSSKKSTKLAYYRKRADCCSDECKTFA